MVTLSSCILVSRSLQHIMQVTSHVNCELVNKTMERWLVVWTTGFSTPNFSPAVVQYL